MRSVCKQWQKAHDQGNSAVAQQWKRILDEVRQKYDDNGIPIDCWPQDMVEQTPWSWFAQCTMRNAHEARKFFGRYWYHRLRAELTRPIASPEDSDTDMGKSLTRSIYENMAVACRESSYKNRPRLVPMMDCRMFHTKVICEVDADTDVPFILGCSEENWFMVSDSPRRKLHWRPMAIHVVIDIYLKRMQMQPSDFSWNRASTTTTTNKRPRDL